MNRINVVESVIRDYNSGLRVFKDLEIENESFANQNLENIVFERCLLYVDFRNANLRNAQFINGHVKTSDFRNADLTNAIFERQSIESAKFKGSKIDGLIFINNSSYSSENLNIEDFERDIKNT